MKQITVRKNWLNTDEESFDLPVFMCSASLKATRATYKQFYLADGVAVAFESLTACMTIL